MKVFAYMPTPGGLTGAPRRLLTLASVLRDEGIEMCIAAQPDSELFMAAEGLGLKTAAVEPAGVLCQRQGALFGGNAVFRLKALFSLWVQNLSIAREIRRHGADVVWIRGSKGIAFAGLGALLSRRPLVWDVDYELPSRGVVRWLHRLGLWMSKAVVFQYATAPTAIFGEALASRYSEKYHAIIPGIDLAKLEKHRLARENRAKGDGKPFVILQVGTVCDRKNQAVMIEALRILNEQRRRSCNELWLAYDEILDLELMDRVENYGLEEEVKLLGWRDDVKELMAQSDVFVMPSKDEGVPNAVQEAMAIGLPVVVSEAGGMPEVVRDGEDGWVLGLDDPAAWAERIRWCQENSDCAEQVGQNAACYAFDHFGTEAWGTEYARVLEEITSCSRAGKNN